MSYFTGSCDAQVVTAVKTDFKTWRKVESGDKRREGKLRQETWMDGWCDRKEEKESREEKKE